MSIPDFNLLLTLDAVLSEGSVVRAAQRLHLSPSAMSRALARLRTTTGDPLLVRAGRGLVPTPRAIELRDQVSRLVHEAESVLRPASAVDLSSLRRSFTLRVREGFVENVGAALIADAARAAPGVRLSFIQKSDKDSTGLRDGRIDLDTGVVGKETGPEVRTRALFRDRFVGVVRPGHPLARGKVTAARYAGGQHIAVSRRGQAHSQLDTALAALALERSVATVTGSFASALALAAQSDLIATVPERQTGVLRAGLHTFVLPFALPELTVSLLWHPRFDADPAHRWLRALVLARFP
ncbi:LysR family transcriptional regulator [Massilia sp. CF038]|uniref:LysR family transcriptional regulator n=1 Tax=Massilia sp. CF038 TaxID=1881045 RepID=UPI00090F5494|nr:LysR family transcriptional regulator [Massilia sp. CF038]SHG75351.1 transcriptional regulator, LysR family [Massilia sp. CF038]